MAPVRGIRAPSGTCSSYIYFKFYWNQAVGENNKKENFLKLLLFYSDFRVRLNKSFSLKMSNLTLYSRIITSQQTLKAKNQ